MNICSFLSLWVGVDSISFLVWWIVEKALWWWWLQRSGNLLKIVWQHFSTTTPVIESLEEYDTMEFAPLSHKGLMHIITTQSLWSVWTKNKNIQPEYNWRNGCKQRTWSSFLFFSFLGKNFKILRYKIMSVFFFITSKKPWRWYGPLLNTLSTTYQKRS